MGEKVRSEERGRRGVKETSFYGFVIKDRQKVSKKKLTRKAVRVLTVFPPQFWINVRAMISKDFATAKYGHCITPEIALAFCSRA